MSEFRLTPKQQEASQLLASAIQHILLYGGSRSAKTFMFTLATTTRALRASYSRHLIARFRLGHVKQSIVQDTFPKVMKLVYPQLKIGHDYELNRSDLYAQFSNGAEIWFGGLDDKERTEKILGTEFATIFLNECSQIPYNSRNMVMTRLAQLVTDNDGNILPLRAYYDENPPTKGHWSYKIFKLKQDPESKQQLRDPDNYGCLQMNPEDNRENLNPEYLQSLEDLPPRLRRRFMQGEFGDEAQGALFSEEVFERWRELNGLPEMLRIVVIVDPSGADDVDNAENDAIGIIVGGLGIDGNGYVMEDLTCKTGPAKWGKVATDAYDRHGADRVVGEDNFGGAMVKHVIQTARPRTPYRSVKASRGKTVRAEPVSALFETGKMRMGGVFRDAEDELCGFTIRGYMGENSPNRADAIVWLAYELFPELTKVDETPKQIIHEPILRGPNDWMRI